MNRLVMEMMLLMVGLLTSATPYGLAFSFADSSKT